MGMLWRILILLDGGRGSPSTPEPGVSYFLAMTGEDSFLAEVPADGFAAIPTDSPAFLAEED